MRRIGSATAAISVAACSGRSRRLLRFALNRWPASVPRKATAPSRPIPVLARVILVNVVFDADVTITLTDRRVNPK
jgi:hypothetical protein